VSFPNRLITDGGLSVDILEKTDMKKRSTSSISDVRSIIETGFKSLEVLKRSQGTTRARRPTKDEKIAIRRMMSSYWDNSSIFSLDLIGAVIRQSSFIEKMHKIDWIHSPSLASTMNRLIVKYERYFMILAKNPGHVAVPTLDVDLAWRTYSANLSRWKGC
jgi:hypothetical protein